ncbi:MAG TPA: hypothetical protein VFX49_05820 [Chloroflexota bacterium]|nr:hypothetical protein [Chloroflexota bacterium]
MYAVWLPMVAGDRKGTWNPSALPDPRVARRWDSEGAAGRWVARLVGRG